MVCELSAPSAEFVVFVVCTVGALFVVMCAVYGPARVCVLCLRICGSIPFVLICEICALGFRSVYICAGMCYLCFPFLPVF